jgi:hypothetical protein
MAQLARDGYINRSDVVELLEAAPQSACMEVRRATWRLITGWSLVSRKGEAPREGETPSVGPLTQSTPNSAPSHAICSRSW